MILNINNVTKTVRYLKKNGAVAAFYAAKERIEINREVPYAYEGPSSDEILRQSKEVAGADLPLITIVMPTYESKPDFLRVAIDSCIAQSYPNWELVIADASETGRVSQLVNKYSLTGTKIKYLKLEANKGIAENTNEGIAIANGDYVAFLDHDDILTPDALYMMARAVADNSVRPALVYSDEDKTDEERTGYFEPNLKYDFNYDLLLTNNYICHFMMADRKILENIRFRGKYNGAQDYDLVLQIIEGLVKDKGLKIADLDEYIVHVPRVLYHWRCHSASTAANTASKMYAYESGLEAVKDHLTALAGSQAFKPAVMHSKHLGFYSVTWGNTWADLMKARPDVGAVIGRKLDRKGNMKPILLNSRGEWLYSGINRHYSGRLNRFDCMQDVYAADIRFMMMNAPVRRLYKSFLVSKGITADEILATLTTENKNINRKDGTVLYIKDLSMEFGKIMHDNGYLILYDPEG